MKGRSAGILLHPTSLPGPFGVGDLGPTAERFLEWAAAAGQSVWQVLPLGPTGYDNSPYGCLSSFAGNPLLISPERLREEGFLPEDALADAPRFAEGKVGFEAVMAWKGSLLRSSWAFFRRAAPREARRELEAFVADRAQPGWLDDWTLYAALKSKHGGKEWTAWARELRRREPEALASARSDLEDEIKHQEYLQFVFFRQWRLIKELANRRGVLVMGDVPFYVAPDSADAWAGQDLFTLGEDGLPEWVAGVPPDYFSETGQLWGNPLYRWDRMRADGFAWWIARLRANLRLADFLRLDHFRAFAAYWAVPASEPTAVNGRWLEGPGEELFAAVRRALGEVPLVVEDLGYITPDVVALRAKLGFPGMKILQFAFGEPDSDYLPHHHPEGAVVYTGTHDNDTSRGWFGSLGGVERRRVLDYLRSDGSAIGWDLIRAAYGSKAALAVIPLQDAFGLGSEARMNTPGTATGNWSWRALRAEFRPELAERLRGLVEASGRSGLAIA